MRLYYYKTPAGNFGDDLNQWLWRQLFPIPIEQCFDDETLFLGIGSILNSEIPKYPPKKIVFGTGYGYGSLPSVTDAWRFICVRGPLTAQALELPPSAAICDSALLVRELVEPARSAEHKIAFMPHHRMINADDWQSVCESLDICYIDPAAPIQNILDKIRSSELVISESLHGAIMADAFRVPWIPVRTNSFILEFKWQDWCASIQLEHNFEWLPSIAIETDSDFKRRHRELARFGRGRMRRSYSIALARSRLRWLARFGKRRLSSEVVFQQVYARLYDTFGKLVEQVIQTQAVKN